MQTRRNFIVRKEDFVCAHCGQQNTVGATIPNHCQFCLYSKHVDDHIPGDRASLCGGLMVPIGVEYLGKKGYRLIHVCERCGHRHKNITSPQDNWDLIINLSTHPVNHHPDA